jgi:DNA gyrase subunit B
VVFVNAQGAEHLINWELAATPECRQLIAKFKQIEQYLEPPYIVETKQRAKKATPAPDEEEDLTEFSEKDLLQAAEQTTQTKKGSGPSAPDIGEDLTEFSEKDLLKVGEDAFRNASPRELFNFVVEQGKKGIIVQRYKGLGEMTAEQLWETTMDPERRTLLQVRLEDIAECETIFTTLMGEDVEARRKFIEDNALDVKNLDI